MKRAIFWLTGLVGLAGACASADVPSNGPDAADPSATVAALDRGVGALSSSFSPDTIAPDAAAGQDPHAGHDMSDPHAGHHHPGASAEPPASATATASSPPPRPTAKKDVAPAATFYTCMHHPEVVSTSKGQCPKCGMDLVPKQSASGNHGGH